MSQTRRDFLRKTGCALGVAALATQIEQFGLINALAQKGGEGAGYKALVCIFLNGGNDGNNTVVPNHSDGSISNYATYNAVRGAQGLAIPQGSLLPITVPRMGGLQYGLHPSLVGLQTLFTQAQPKLAIVTNVGSLVSPLTRTTYQNNSVPKPYQLFSHSDQINQQQSSVSATAVYSGWGGRIADRTGSQNPSALVPMITSIAGAQLFTNGQSTSPMAISAAPTQLNQVLALSGYDATGPSVARRTALDQLRTVDLSSTVIKAASDVTQLAIGASVALNQPDPVLTTAFPNTGIGNQLKQVAKLLAVRSSLNMNRQIFFCSLSGFDTHTTQVTGQATLLTQLSQAMKAFYDETVAQGISANVTTFTQSDFGRTFLPTGVAAADVGSDHAWGNHAFVMGGSVIGGDFYGMNSSNGTPFPTLQLSGPDDTDTRGRWIPKTATDQFAATLATWFGLSPSDLPIVFPFLSNFGSNNLGFMA